MSMWTAIALISIACIISGIFNDKGKRRHSAKTAKEFEAMNDRLDALETDLRRRVETLERIVTNPKVESCNG